MKMRRKKRTLSQSDSQTSKNKTPPATGPSIASKKSKTGPSDALGAADDTNVGGDSEHQSGNGAANKKEKDKDTVGFMKKDVLPVSALGQFGFISLSLLLFSKLMICAFVPDFVFGLTASETLVYDQAIKNLTKNNGNSRQAGFNLGSIASDIITCFLDFLPSALSHIQKNTVNVQSGINTKLILISKTPQFSELLRSGMPVSLYSIWI
jgi:hypothetical protein